MPVPDREERSPSAAACERRPVVDAAGSTVGWDVGGAHLKACVTRRGEVLDVAQWMCPLWQGMDALDAALARAHERWPGLERARHAVTMTGEMVDLFRDREDGVRRIAACLAQYVGGDVAIFAGDAGWRGPAEAASAWPHVASANWLATARHAALHTAAYAGDEGGDERGDGLGGDGLAIDIGSTTTDIVAFRDGSVLTTARSDADRLASGELVYCGVVRTPLCALAPRIAWRGRSLNVMKELFATTADVYRLTGELDPAHDLYPPADAGPKDADATRRRLARMIGLDAREAADKEWLAFARAWREAQVVELAGEVRRVVAGHRLDAAAVVVVGAGCGDFLVGDVLIAAGLGTAATRALRYGTDVARFASAAASAGTTGASGGGADPLAAWAQVCAPCVAVAALHDRDFR